MPRSTSHAIRRGNAHLTTWPAWRFLLVFGVVSELLARAIPPDDRSLPVAALIALCLMVFTALALIEREDRNGWWILLLLLLCTYVTFPIDLPEAVRALLFVVVMPLLGWLLIDRWLTDRHRERTLR